MDRFQGTASSSSTVADMDPRSMEVSAAGYPREVLLLLYSNGQFSKPVMVQDHGEMD